MYYDFFGLKEPPFSIAPDPRYLYMSDRHKEALAHLMYGVQGQGGFIVVTGEVGTGKTTVCRCFIENAPSHVDIALILNPRLSARELLSSVCDELEIDHTPDASIKVMVDAINQDLLKAHAAGRHKVLIIDEAQNLSADVLEQLRLLTNLETAEKKLLQIVLLGQPELQDVLALPELRQLNQRVTARYHLDAIGRDELPAYLQYRLGVAGLRIDIFSSGAVRRLYSISGGVPRLINLIADRALLGAYAGGDHQISADHIRQAAKEVGGGRPLQARRKAKASVLRASSFVFLLLSLALAVLSTLMFFQPGNASRPAMAGAGAPAPLQGTIERAPEQDVANRTPMSGVATVVAGPEFDLQRHTLALGPAFRALLALWGEVNLPASLGVACDFAQSRGLACLERQGTRRSLEFLDRPAILTLRPGAGQPTYVVVSRLDGNRATIETTVGPVTVEFDELEAAWFGEFRVLWKMPDYMTAAEEAQPAARELWLGARMMQLADRLEDEAAERSAVKRLGLEEQVRWYQARRGLTVDGIPGAMTLIQMRNDLQADVPRLVREGPGAGD
ncbi:MAG TPA: AAA family ATPase [Marinobacter sp.]|nr:AAA family ATPase [Marinobacter sp.]